MFVSKFNVYIIPGFFRAHATWAIHLKFITNRIYNDDDDDGDDDNDNDFVMLNDRPKYFKAHLV